jgi:hypothetical protein
MRRGLYFALLATAGACAGILGLRAPEGHRFEHRAHVLKGISCLRCHAGVETAGETGPLHLPQDKDCTSAGCHDKPHDERSCLGCHTLPYAASDVAQARQHLRFRHDEHVPELEGNCARCHADVAKADAPLRPRMATCLGCHEHKDDFEVRQCDRCHVDMEREGSAPASHIVHDGDFLREHGTRAGSEADLCMSCHAEKFCAGCHGANVPALPARMAFDDPRTASVHRAGFRSRHAEEAHADPGTCSACHAPSSCLDCHDREGVGGGATAPRSPHPPGWVGIGAGANRHGIEARKDPMACASCHGGAGEALCVGCHKVGGVGGSPHPVGWTSDRPLTAAPCRLCHTP